MIFFSKQENGFYNSDIHSVIPVDAVEVRNSDYEKLMAGQSAGQKIQPDSSGIPVLVTISRSISEQKGFACTAIDTAAGAARTQFATSSAFIESEYQRSYDTAVAWINSGYQGEAPKPVKSDAEAFGRTDQEAAQYIKSTGDYWFSKLDEIRDIRLKGKQAVETAPDDADFNSVAQPFIDQLEALKPEDDIEEEPPA